MVLDLIALNRVEYDASSETARIGVGATLHDINVELQRRERMAPIGIAPPTGCGGLVLHGHGVSARGDSCCEGDGRTLAAVELPRQLDHDRVRGGRR